jgi:hypothetical protein
MPTSTNKGYEVQTTGSNTGTWGSTLNSNVIQYIDDNLGGITSKSLSNVNVTLSSAESRTAILRLTGVLTGAVVITTECIGFFFVENLTTGSFAVTVRNSSISTAATIPQSTRQTVISDATNGCRLAVTPEFPTGTVMTFRQTSAPTGWTKETSLYNNSAFRCVTGTPSSGGTADFTTALAARTITVSNIPDMTISITDPGHVHTYSKPTTASRDSSSGGTTTSLSQSTIDTSSATTGITAAFGSTARGGAQTAMDFAVKYVDLILATKT